MCCAAHRPVVCLSLRVYAAIPISEYQQNLKNAIARWRCSLQTKKSEIPDYESRVNADDRDQFAQPCREHQTVESDGEAYNVDNSWLHQALDELKQARLTDPKEIEQIVDASHGNRNASGRTYRNKLKHLKVKTPQRRDLKPFSRDPNTRRK